MSKIKVRNSDVENYMKITQLLNAKYGSEGWKWAPWAFEAGPGGTMLSSPVKWQDVLIPGQQPTPADEAV